MAENNLRKRILEKLHNRYRLIIYNDTTFQSVWTLKLTRLKVFTLVSLSSAFLIFLVIFLIASTPLKEYIPGYPREEYREMLIRNMMLVDSLENEIGTRDRFFSDMRSVITGEVPREDGSDTIGEQPVNRVSFKAYNSDSVFQDKLLEERLNLGEQPEGTSSLPPNKLHFFMPVQGYVTDKFDAGKEHYGVDIVGKANSRISAALGGTVLFAGWTRETGNVMYLLHGNNLVTAYKHNALLLKKTGEKVSAGEAIAIIGNTGELSTGPHLHFELWYEGEPIDPGKYIDF